ncbi:MAG: M14 family zinc carboxypeptidase [Bdellovibrionota bacterium]
MIHEPSWARSALGTPIGLFASLPLPQMKKLRPILLMGGIHGDEPEGVWLAGRTLEMLRQDAAKVRVPWALIPCLNVDGLAHKTRVNGRGVDLNRNYPSRNWAPHSEKPRYPPGASPGSEPEIQAVVRLIGELQPRLIIHCHSWEPCIVYAGAPGRRDAERLARSSGYETRGDIGYPTPGALSQYGWGDLRIPVICIEEKSGTPEAEIWPHFEGGMREIFGDGSMR